MTTLQTSRQLASYFGLTMAGRTPSPEDLNGATHEASLLRRIRAVQIAGARHGKAGFYPDGDYSSDADWCYGIGREIRDLEAALDIDDAAVFDLYQAAHEAFFRDGTINPSERSAYMRNSCFTFRFGAYGDTTVSVWAQADHLEDALELAAEWLAEHAPGLFTEPDYKAAAEDLGVDFASWSSGDLDDCNDYGRVTDAAEADLTYTESGYLNSWEWTFSEDDSAPGHDPSHAGPRHYGPARNADGTRK